MSRSQFHSIKLFILTHAWLNLWDERMTTGRINQVTIIWLVDWGRSVLLWHTTSGTSPTHQMSDQAENLEPPERPQSFFCEMLSASASTHCCSRNNQSSIASPFAYLGSLSAYHGEAFIRAPSTDAVEASPRQADSARSIESNASERFNP